MPATAFSAGNGILFENPALVGRAFRDAFGKLQVGTRTAEANEAYRELLELGIVNSQTQIGDLKNLLRDVNFGDKLTDLDSMISPMMSRLKKIPEYLQGKYVAEDDFWKITNYFVELERRQNAYKKVGINKSIDDLLDEEHEEMVLVPDPEITDEELSEDLIEYFITTEEYEKCAKIKDLMQFRDMIDNILNQKNVK